jgi:acyl-CoA synthetase (AMP-forming)/AMP-acid ligase II
MIAVPAFPPGSTRNFDRIDAIARDCDATIVLADGADMAGTDRGLSAESGSALARARWLAAEDSGRPDHGQDWTPPSVTGDWVAFLQYTSGSTATPKGVMVSHRNLLANARAGKGCFGLGPDTTMVNWVPPYHDMGLIGGVITPLYSMFTAVHMTSAAFIRSPLRWLEAITRYRAVLSCAPDFAYRLCVGRVSEQAKQGLDLSSWKLALNGSEPVRAQVLDQFAAAFASCGFEKTSFTPCYGLAENTLVVSGKPPRSGVPVVLHVSKPALEQGKILPPSDPGDVQQLVSCGTTAPGVTLRIVDPQTGRPALSGAVGEV